MDYSGGVKGYVEAPSQIIGGAAKGMLRPPLKLLGEPAPPPAPSLPTPMVLFPLLSVYMYGLDAFILNKVCQFVSVTMTAYLFFLILDDFG